MPGATQSVVINVPPKVIYDVVVDFKNYTEFLPETKRVTILKKSAKSVEVEFEIKVIKTLKYSLKFSLSPQKKITWSLIKGDLFKENKGSWTFKSQGKNKTETTYNVDIELGILVPRVITNMLVGNSLPSMLNAFKKEAESRA